MFSPSLYGSIFRLVGVGKEQRFAEFILAEVCDQRLCARREQKIAKGLRARYVDFWVLRRIDFDYVIDVEQRRIALQQNVELQILFQGQVRGAVTDGIAVLLRCDVEGRAHAL